MDEGAYVERKKQGWARLSEVLDRAGRRGVRALAREELADLGARYRALVSDLAYARTQGASEELVTYLNELAGRAHGVVFAAPVPRLRGIVRFIAREFPALVRSSSVFSLAAAAVFFLGWAIAAYLIGSGSDVGRRILPEGLGGVPGGPIAAPDPAAMSSYIMTNNIKVAILAFAGGITGGLVSAGVLFWNGLMIGLVAAIAAPRVGQVKFWSLILPHGVIELTAIFIAGGAGLMIGAAIIAPGNLRRADAVRLAAQKAVRLFAGTVALLFAAGIIEGFITPSVISEWSKLVFAGVTALGLVLYLGFAGRE